MSNSEIILWSLTIFNTFMNFIIGLSIIAAGVIEGNKERGEK